MGDLLLSKAVLPSGEVTDPIPLHDWRAAARCLSGFTLTDTVLGVNPFTRTPIAFPRPGSGIWKTGSRDVHVVFDCGVAALRDAVDVDGRALHELAAGLGATVREYVVPAFLARRASLATIIRSALAGLPPRSSVFTRGRQYAPSTPTLLLECSDEVASEEAIAAALGHPDAVLPVDLIEQVAESASRAMRAPSDELLVKALVHFLEHDAFLP
jgi:hypothetical protein